MLSDHLHSQLNTHRRKQQQPQYAYFQSQNSRCYPAEPCFSSNIAKEVMIFVGIDKRLMNICTFLLVFCEASTRCKFVELISSDLCYVNVADIFHISGKKYPFQRLSLRYGLVPVKIAKIKRSLRKITKRVWTVCLTKMMMMMIRMKRVRTITRTTMTMTMTIWQSSLRVL